MNSSRPYIIRAIYEWIVDNDCTPHLLVDVEVDGVEVPQAYVSDGQIVLNISPTAVVGLDMSNEYVAFNGRFGGVATDIIVPIERYWESMQEKMVRGWCLTPARSLTALRTPHPTKRGQASKWSNSGSRDELEQLYHTLCTAHFRRFQCDTVRFSLGEQAH